MPLVPMPPSCPSQSEYGGPYELAYRQQELWDWTLLEGARLQGYLQLSDEPEDELLEEEDDSLRLLEADEELLRSSSHLLRLLDVRKLKMPPD